MRIFLLLLTVISSLFAGIGQITTLKGTAELTRLQETLTAEKGMQIELKDLLETETSSKAQVILNDDTVITIGPSSAYHFNKYQEGSDADIEMQLDHGFFKAVTGKIGKIAPERFKIKTKAATIGIRGTQFMAYVDDQEERIGCIQGTIIVWTDEGEFIVKAGEMLWYKDQHWQRTPMDNLAFEPVMVGMQSPTEHHYYQGLFLPEFQDNFVLQEQILNDLQATEPFSLDLGFDDSVQPPPFNP